MFSQNIYLKFQIHLYIVRNCILILAKNSTLHYEEISEDDLICRNNCDNNGAVFSASMNCIGDDNAINSKKILTSGLIVTIVEKFIYIY